MSRGPGVPWIGLALVSGSALAYEILLTRLLALVHWHHLATMVISLALLGYGASGTLLYLARPWVRRHIAAAFLAGALVFAAGAPICFHLAQAVPFDPGELAWDWVLLWRLAYMYLLLSVPFLGAAACVGVAFMGFGDRAHRLYASDLLGAGAGALLVVGLLYLAPAGRVLWLVSALGLAAAAVAALELRIRGRVTVSALLLAGASALALVPERLAPVTPAPYKDLTRSLTTLGASVLERRTGPLGELDLVGSADVPFRFAPGLSLASPHRPPPQLGLFHDGNAVGTLPATPEGLAETGYLDYLTSALPYHLLPGPDVLLVGLSGGGGLLQALALGAARVVALEADPQRVALVEGRLAGLPGRGRVGFVAGEPRGQTVRDETAYDLIQLDFPGGESGGLQALSPGYLLTREALGVWLDHLAPGGLLSITLWHRLPPRAVLKLAATLAEVLESRSLADPGRHLALIRGLKTLTLVVGDAVMDPTRIEAARSFCRDRAFDPVWLGGADRDPAERGKDGALVDGLAAVLGSGRAAFIDAYPFDLRPADDDRPFFDDFARWDALPGLLRLPASGGLAHLDWGYWIQVATLAQAVVLGAALILLPLAAVRRLDVTPGLTGRMLGFFLMIGLAFMLVEVAFIQRLELILGYPVLAVAVTLSAFLVFAGLGSALSPALLDRIGAHCRHPLRPLVLGLSVLAAADLALLAWATPWIMAQPLGTRAAAALLGIAPLAFCMGLPFPWGMGRLAREAPGLVPWAWGVNGFASVVSAVLAGVLAVEIGFGGLVGAGLLAYGLAAVLFPGNTPPAGGVASPQA